MKDTITIPYPILARNAIDKVYYMNRGKFRKQYAESVWIQMRLGNMRKANPYERFKLAIVTYRTRLILDWDGLIGGAKQMLDALTHKHSCFIWDDARQFIGIPDIRQEKCKKGEERTIITRETVE